MSTSWQMRYVDATSGGGGGNESSGARVAIAHSTSPISSYSLVDDTLAYAEEPTYERIPPHGKSTATATTATVAASSSKSSYVHTPINEVTLQRLYYDNNKKQRGDDQSRREFVDEHIFGARLLMFANLSHAGVPVHPLQLQRLVRNLGVDEDCHIVLYDRGQHIWAAYAFFIFKLFGHTQTSVLNGGLVEWRSRSHAQSNLYQMQTQSAEDAPGRLGSFRARWCAECIATFDDVIANFDTHHYSIIDAQNEEEYAGRAKGASYGHIRTAVNVPIESVFDWANNTWLTREQHVALLASKELPIDGAKYLVYDGTSLRSTMLFFALHRLGVETAVYFGSWPEFVIRAPDVLKVIRED